MCKAKRVHRGRRLGTARSAAASGGERARRVVEQLVDREAAGDEFLHQRHLDRELQRQSEQRARLKGEYRQADFGSQMRTYYLHPYTLVKDHRSEHETSNVQAVLDGDIDSFVEAYLHRNIGRDGAE